MIFGSLVFQTLTFSGSTLPLSARVVANVILCLILNLVNHPMDVLKSVNDSLSAAFQASSWIRGPETGIFLEWEVLNHDYNVVSRVVFMTVVNLFMT